MVIPPEKARKGVIYPLKNVHLPAIWEFWAYIYALYYLVKG